MERLLDEAGQRAQEVERGAAQAVEEMVRLLLPPRAWAEPLGTWGAWLKEQPPWRPPRAIAGGAACGLARGTGWVLENTLFRPQQGRTSGPPTATQPQHFTLRTGSSTSGRPASTRSQASASRRSPTTRPFSWGLNPVALPQSQSSRASSSSGQSRRSLPPPSFDQLARDIEAA